MSAPVFDELIHVRPPAHGERAAVATALGRYLTLVVNSGLRGQSEFRQLKAGQVAGTGPIEGMAVPLGIQADQVECDR
jgi:hypothetical protein